jgi:arsenate reductase
VTSTLGRRATAEFVATAMLVAIVVGSGIFAQRLSPHDVGLQLLENSLATGAGLTALILSFGPISGAHLNPVVTLVDRVLTRGMSTATAGVYIVSQVAGACVGAVVANLMFGLHAVTISHHARLTGGTFLGEVVATFGLLTVIAGVARRRRNELAPFAVGAYITSAYWFTSSTSFANPAVTIGRTLSDTFAGIRPSSVPGFVTAQLCGGALAALLAWYLHGATVQDEELIVDREELPA